MSGRPAMLFVLALALAACSTPMKTAKEVNRPMFNPSPLSDDWTKWMVGEWEVAGASDTGRGKGINRIEVALLGQFLICREKAEITEMTADQVNYLKTNMHASDEEIARFRSGGYQAMEFYTIDQTTGEMVGFLFDSLRCMATGRGRREGNRLIMDWVWATGHKSTRITEKVSEDRMMIIQRTPMPDGRVMEEKGESIRRKKL
jgi:hypothetical protein